MDDSTLEFAIKGEHGLDIFERIDDTGHKRARFHFIATVPDGVASAAELAKLPGFESGARTAEQVFQIAKAFTDDPVLTTPFALAAVPTWPIAAQSDAPLRLFLYVEFFRAWQVTDMAARRLIAQAETDPAMLVRLPPSLPGQILPCMEFNLIHHARPIARLVLKALSDQDEQIAGNDDIAFALRMLGDLCRRAGDFPLALTCFERSIEQGDNPYRRIKAIEAAYLAEDLTALAHHGEAYRAKWPLPEQLARLLEAGK